MSAIEWSDDTMRLGREDMDDTHREMIRLINVAIEADNANFAAAYRALVEHTNVHFAHESDLMQTHADPARKEHEHQHAKLLGELAGISRRVVKGQYKFARAFLRERLPEWFVIHAASMDSMLAAHLKSVDEKQSVK